MLSFPVTLWDKKKVGPGLYVLLFSHCKIQTNVVNYEFRNISKPTEEK